MKLYLPVLISALLLTPPSSVSHARKLIDKTVLTVNEDIILESDITEFQKKIKSKSFQELFGGIDESVAQNRDAILQLLVEEKIINQQVKKLELAASDQEVEGQIRSILKRNGITPAQLQERLKQLGTSMDSYKDGIRRQIERRNLVEREIKPNLEVSDEQLRHYYSRNPSPEDKERQFKIAHILVDASPRGTTTPQMRADAIYKELKDHPEKFDAFVKDSSDDSGTAATGGILGFYTSSQLAKEFRDVVPKTSVGKVTAPIKTSAGYHIVKVLETRSGGDFSALSKERKEALKNQMMSEELEKRMAMWLERRKNEAFIRKSVANAPKPAPAKP